MNTPLEIFLLGMLITAGLHRAWFATQLPVHVFQLIYWSGIWGLRKQWPPSDEIQFWLRHECEMWWTINTPSWVGELLSCQVCLSYHLSFWVAILMCAAGAPTWILGVWLAWPELINLLPGHK